MNPHESADLKLSLSLIRAFSFLILEGGHSLGICDEVFGIHDDVRHIVVVDGDGRVVNVCSRAKREWSRELIKETAGVIARIVTGIFDGVKEISGNVENIIVTFEKMKLLITKTKSGNILLISTRKRIPQMAIEKVFEVAQSL